jgi:hypothetical protein
VADAGNEHDEAALAAVARHALHDEELIAAFATGDIEAGADADRAQGLIDRCSICRDLHHDLVDIRAALRVAAASTLTAPRDFRLSLEDARRLGGRPTARGFLAGLRESIATFGRPAGVTLATFGLVGLLVSSIELGNASAPTPMAVDGGATGGPAAGQIRTGEEAPGAPKASGGTTAFGPAASPNDAGTVPTTPDERDQAASGLGLTAWLLLGSLSLLGAGLVLVVLAYRGGRRVDIRMQDR